MKLGIKITGIDDNVCDDKNRDAVTVFKTYELVTDGLGTVCFVDDDDEFNYGVGTDTVYLHSIVAMEE